MESGNRTVWIVVAVIVVGVLLCCCVVVAGAAVAGLYAFPISREVGFARMEETTEQVFIVGEAPSLEVENFAGRVTVRSGESGEIRVAVTKRALSSDRLDQIDVNVSEQDDGVRIRTSGPGVLTGNMSVDLEAFVPADARLELDTRAGNVEVDDVRGEISTHSGAGNVRVQGAAAPVRLDTNAGEIDYEGEPEGDCFFNSAAGNITLRLPADANVEVRLRTGVGNINLGDFDVEGETSRTEVEGMIGTGGEATIEARTGAGNITLVPH
jgi:DUF4097 and DUF4098 domain-containing protein YvlB